MHPGASIVQRGHHIRTKCFVADQRRIILPAFGSYTGALNVLSVLLQACLDEAHNASLDDRQNRHPPLSLEAPGLISRVRCVGLPGWIVDAQPYWLHRAVHFRRSTASGVFAFPAGRPGSKVLANGIGTLVGVGIILLGSHGIPEQGFLGIGLGAKATFQQHSEIELAVFQAMCCTQ